MLKITRLPATVRTLIALAILTLPLLTSSGCATSQLQRTKFNPASLSVTNPSRIDCPHVFVEDAKTGTSHPARCIIFVEGDAVDIIADRNAACIALVGKEDPRCQIQVVR